MGRLRGTFIPAFSILSDPLKTSPAIIAAFAFSLLSKKPCSTSRTSILSLDSDIPILLTFPVKGETRGRNFRLRAFTALIYLFFGQPQTLAGTMFMNIPDHILRG
ncbi:hypothetical protein D1872_225560 [compost metagenome]